MIQNLDNFNPGPLSPNNSFYSPSTTSKSTEELHMGDAEGKPQATDIDATSTALSSSEKADWEDATGGGLASQYSGIEKITTARSQTSEASPESTGERRRSTILTGPQAPIPRRRSSVPVRGNGQDLMSFHRQSCRLFQSLEGTLASNHDWANDAKQPYTTRSPMSRTRPSSQYVLKTDNGFAYLTSTTSFPLYGSSTTNRRPSSVAMPPRPFYGGLHSPSAPTNSFSSLVGMPSSSFAEKPTAPSTCSPPRPQPVSIISWTSTESRRFEYQRIDRSHSGIRGVWKKLTPRWCHGRHVRHGFFNSRNGAGDAESVRRYRMALEEDDDSNDNDEDDDDDNHGKNEGHMDMEKMMNKNKSKTRNRNQKWKWNCFNLLR